MGEDSEEARFAQSRFPSSVSSQALDRDSGTLRGRRQSLDSAQNLIPHPRMKALLSGEFGAGAAGARR